MSNWHLVQLFLSRREDDPRVFEVYADTEDLENFRCTCPGWEVRHRCAHCDVVARNWLHGKPFRILAKASAESPKDIIDDPVAFRRWIYENTVVMMLEENS